MCCGKLFALESAGEVTCAMTKSRGEGLERRVSSVVAVRLSPVELFSTATWAPTMAASWTSLTVPAMRPVVWVWDQATAEQSSHRNMNRAIPLTALTTEQALILFAHLEVFDQPNVFGFDIR